MKIIVYWICIDKKQKMAIVQTLNLNVAINIEYATTMVTLVELTKDTRIGSNVMCYVCSLYFCNILHKAPRINFVCVIKTSNNTFLFWICVDPISAALSTTILV